MIFTRSIELKVSYDELRNEFRRRLPDGFHKGYIDPDDCLLFYEGRAFNMFGTSRVPLTSVFFKEENRCSSVSIRIRQVRGYTWSMIGISTTGLVYVLNHFNYSVQIITPAIFFMSMTLGLMYFRFHLESSTCIESLKEIEKKILTREFEGQN